jgi:hypothetical protein
MGLAVFVLFLGWISGEIILCGKVLKGSDPFSAVKCHIKKLSRYIYLISPSNKIFGRIASSELNRLLQLAMGLFMWMLFVCLHCFAMKIFNKTSEFLKKRSGIKGNTSKEYPSFLETRNLRDFPHIT